MGRALGFVVRRAVVVRGLLGHLMGGSSSAPAVGIANEDQGLLGATVASALAKSSAITTSSVNASDGDSRLRDGSLTAYIVFPADFSRQAQVGTIAPDVHLEGSQPGTIAPVLQPLQQALLSVASPPPGQAVPVQPRVTCLSGGPDSH